MLKNILGFGVVAFFAYKGISHLMKYDKGVNDFVDTISEVGKDAIDGINNIITIFSDNQIEKDACDGLSELTKKGIDVAVVAKKDIYD